MTVETYPEMNAKIVDILQRDKDNPLLFYAAQRIEELEAEVERLRAELEPEEQPAPDVLPCGHPREAMKSDGVTHWCTKCEGENWRVRATINRLVSNIPAACGVLREQGCVNLAGQLGRDYDNLVYWQEHGGLVEAKEKEEAR